MAASPSFMLRAVMALVLMAGFYVLAIVIAGALLFLVWADVQGGGRVHPKLIIGGLIGAGTILWSIMPRFDRFQPPGPQLTETEHPELFAALREVAEATEQAMPAEVYLIPDVNAWVAQRGGVLGFGGRRVMGLGLPLLQGLSRARMRAVLAHEFGHYHGGDTSLGPLLYRTRMAIGRSVENLGESILQLPFRAYSAMFLRVTHASSRAQEYAADALAARVCGAGAMIGGLRALPGLSQAFPAYWQSEFIPLLEGGHRPPLAGGFRRFLDHPRVADQVGKVREVALGESAGDPYDTHPPLPERIAALEGLPAGDAARDDDEPAIGWLRDVPALEEQLLAHLFGAEPIGGLTGIAWDDVGEQVHVPRFRGQLAPQAAVFDGVTLGEVGTIAAEPADAANRLTVSSDAQPDDEQRRGYVVHLVGAALALALHGRGWSVVATPGDPITLDGEGRRVEPFAAAGSVAAGEMGVDQWRELVRSCGVEDVRVGELAQATG